MMIEEPAHLRRNSQRYATEVNLDDEDSDSKNDTEDDNEDEDAETEQTHPHNVRAAEPTQTTVATHIPSPTHLRDSDHDNPSHTRYWSGWDGDGDGDGMGICHKDGVGEGGSIDDEGLAMAMGLRMAMAMLSSVCFSSAHSVNIPKLVSRQGTLLKKSPNVFHGWQPRQFILHEDDLVYYKKSSTRPRGIIDLAKVIFSISISISSIHLNSLCQSPSPSNRSEV